MANGWGDKNQKRKDFGRTRESEAEGGVEQSRKKRTRAEKGTKENSKIRNCHLKKNGHEGGGKYGGEGGEKGGRLTRGDGKGGLGRKKKEQKRKTKKREND